MKEFRRYFTGSQYSTFYVKFVVWAYVSTKVTNCTTQEHNILKKTYYPISSNSYPSATANKAIYCLKWGGVTKQREHHIILTKYEAWKYVGPLCLLLHDRNELWTVRPHAVLLVCLYLFVWLRITDEGSVPEMCIWSLLFMKSDLKWVIHLD